MTPGRDRRVPPRVAIVGTFDVANFGDLLFPLLAQRELERRLGPIELRNYSYREMSAPPWPYSVRSIDRLAGDLRQCDLVLVGGGHLVRFDTAVAPGYEPTSSQIHHPTGYWLAPTIMAAAQGLPVAWNSVGVSPETPAWALPLLTWALDAADYVAVRDRSSLLELERVSPSTTVFQVPDTAFGIGELLGRGIDGQSSGAPDAEAPGSYVIIQASSKLGAAHAEIQGAIDAIRADGRTVLELPVSPALGDRPGAGGWTGTEAVDPWPAPLDLAGLISGADAVIAHSLHLTIVALTSGVPVFRLPPPKRSKYEALVRYAGVRPLDGEAARTVAAARRGRPAPDVVEQQAQLGRHWDRIAALVDDDDERRRGARQQRSLRHLLEVPALLQEASGTASRAESARARAERIARASTEQRHALDVQLAAMVATLESTALQQAASDRLVAEQQSLLASREAESARFRAEVENLQRAATSDRQQLQQEIALRDTRLVETSSQGQALTRAQKELAEARRDLEEVNGKLKRTEAATARFRSRRSVRLASGAADSVRSLLRPFRGGARGPVAPADKAATPQPQARAVSASAGPAGASPAVAVDIAEERRRDEAARALTQRLLRELPRDGRKVGPLVSMIVLNLNGAHHLRRLLPALDRTTYQTFELIVVDNGSTDDSVAYLRGGKHRFPIRIIQNETNRSFVEGCNQGEAQANGDLILLLNNDIEPISPGWLGRMVSTLGRSNAAAVGARLIYPRRPGLDNAGDRSFPDLTLQHRGIGFYAADGVPAARNLGAGEDPLSARASETRDVAGVTGACMLLDRAALRDVGGLTDGFVYGTEDVDLCLKLRAAGGRIVYDGGAALWHHEYGTQNAHGREWKRANRAKNRQLFVDRWGPQLFREVFADRVDGRAEWSEDPLHVGVTLSRDDPAAGWGDYYTAHELGAAFEALGWKVTYLERYQDRWYKPDETIDVVVSLLDSLDLRKLPRHFVTVAWVRNWTHRWIEHPWFDNYDVVFASSETSRQLIEERTARVAELMPLATNPERFRPVAPATDLQTDVLFVGNYWGQPRGVLDSLSRLNGNLGVRVFGKGWSQTPLARWDHGPLEYDRLPEAYSSTRIVVDDTAGPTKPYGAVNARVFDALAAGAIVVTDNAEGAAELFDADFPVAAEPGQFPAVVKDLVADPERASRLAARYRAVVLEHHTYANRAAQFRAALAAWGARDRVSVLIGPSTWERALSWGDLHFARRLQRELEHAGRPARLFVLPEWERPPAARSDAVIHLFGLSEYRTRPSQVNILWNISHPDLLTTNACERYDQIFVASERFAAELAPRVSVPVLPLHQATDPARFRPEPLGPAHELLFVANSRKVPRKIIEDLLPTDHELAVYGRDWDAAGLDSRFLKGEYVPNEILHRYYSSATIVLSDHWDDMRTHGFLSNRLYDALASGAFVISDDVAGIEEEFEGAVVTYTDRDDLRRKIAYYLRHDAERRALADRGRRLVMERHTFVQRAGTMLQHVDRIAAARPRGVRGWAQYPSWLGRRGTRMDRWQQGASRTQPGELGAALHPVVNGAGNGTRQTSPRTGTPDRGRELVPTHAAGGASRLAAR